MFVCDSLLISSLLSLCLTLSWWLIQRELYFTSALLLSQRQIAHSSVVQLGTNLATFSLRKLLVDCRGCACRHHHHGNTWNHYLGHCTAAPPGGSPSSVHFTHLIQRSNTWLAQFTASHMVLSWESLFILADAAQQFDSLVPFVIFGILRCPFVDRTDRSMWKCLNERNLCVLCLFGWSHGDRLHCMFCEATFIISFVTILWHYFILSILLYLAFCVYYFS